MRIGMRLLMLLAIVMAALPEAEANGALQPRVYQEEFHVRSAGDAVVPGWLEDDADTAELMAASGCAALGFSCADGEDGAFSAVRYIRRSIRSGFYSGTALLLRARGARSYARFVAPKGFTTCRAGIFLGEGAISPGATFAAAIQRPGRDGLAVYADLGAGDEPRFIEFRLLVLYVATGESQLRGCWPDQTIIVLCRAAERCRASAAYPQTDLR